MSLSAQLSHQQIHNGSFFVICRATFAGVLSGAACFEINSLRFSRKIGTPYLPRTIILSPPF